MVIWVSFAFHVTPVWNISSDLWYPHGIFHYLFPFAEGTLWRSGRSVVLWNSQTCSQSGTSNHAVLQIPSLLFLPILTLTGDLDHVDPRFSHVDWLICYRLAFELVLQIRWLVIMGRSLRVRSAIWCLAVSFREAKSWPSPRHRLYFRSPDKETAPRLKPKGAAGGRSD